MNVLFVCTANVCRSPLAEIVFRKKLLEHGISNVIVTSAGIHDYAGMPYDEMMVSLAQKAGYDFCGIARHLTQQMADEADIIICMQHHQMVELQKSYVPYTQWNRIHRFNEICFGEQSDLMDPSGDTEYMHKYVLERIVEGCENLIEKLMMTK